MPASSRATRSFRRRFRRIGRRSLRIALKRSPEVNYHLAYLPRIAPWLAAFRAASRPSRLIETAQVMRPLFARAVAEHEALAAEAGAERYLSRRGWLKLYRTDGAFAAQARELDLAARFGIANVPLDRERGACARAVAGAGFPPRRALDRRGEREQSAGADARLRRALCRARRACAHWRRAHAPSRQSVLARGDRGRAARCRRRGDRARSVDAGRARAARHQAAARRQARLSPPFPSARQTPRSAARCSMPRTAIASRPWSRASASPRASNSPPAMRPPTPVQFDRVLPAARELFALGEPVEAQPWLGARPCFPDSRPVIARAPRQRGLWLAYGHAHWGLTLGPATGRLLAEMMTGATPFCDPKPYARTGLRGERHSKGRTAHQSRVADVGAGDPTYSPIVWTTLSSGRVLFDDSLSCCMTISSYFGSVVSGCARHHVDDLVAAGLELPQQFRHRLGRRLLEVMHQDDALAALLQLASSPT